MSPFLALYGYHPPSITSSLKVSPRVQAVEDHLLHQQHVLLGLKENLAMAQNRMKQQVDQHRSERNFEVGDWVFLRLQPYKQISMKQQKRIISCLQDIMDHTKSCKRLVVLPTSLSFHQQQRYIQFFMFLV